MLPARHRLRSSADFSSAVRGPGGSRSGGRLIVIHAHRTDTRTDQPPRVGLVVSKAVGAAVVRTRTKRVLRHQLAARIASLPTGWDLVVRANPAAAGASSVEIGMELDRLLPRALRERR
ncbi:MAG: ribonuclease P protein component [Actinomycetota bacterium]|nr:ribonuclease P protein component [Actinomycetota bacterium]